MTREDAVTTLKDISEMVHKQKEIEKSTLYGILDSNNEPVEALDMAIKALEQEPCDCISREEVCDYIAEFVNHEYATDRERELVKNIIGGIQHLPSIQPKAKTGHWIACEEVDDCNGVDLWYECSECGRSVDAPITEEFMLKDYPYCHCGAKMLPTDSEREE